MRVLHSEPPHRWLVELILGPLPDRVIFAFGDRIYNPSGGTLTAALQAHEAVHARQQGRCPWIWWFRYLLSPRFRLAQELEAHRAEWGVARKTLPGPARRRYLRELSNRLASDMYGGLLTPGEAREAILS